MITDKPTTTIVTVTSQKGGVAKTTSAVAIAHGLAMRSAADVLLIDFDPQGQAAISLGHDPEPGLFNWLINDQHFDNVTRLTTRAGLTLLPGNGHTKRAELWLRNESTLDQLIRRVYAIAGDFDCVVIDTPANGYLQELAMRLADVLVIPVRCEMLGMDGVGATMATTRAIGNAQRTIILPTMFDRRLREHAYNLDLLHRNYPDRVADPVPARVAVAEAVAMGLTVWEHGNGSMIDVRDAYTALIGRIVCEGRVTL